MKRETSKWIAICSIAFAFPLNAADYGFPTCNTLGRYFGVGWSHHSYHSQVNGRFNILDQRHPASDYPSRNLSYPYSPHYIHYSATGPQTVPAATDWVPPVSGNTFADVQLPTLAPPPSDQRPKKAPEKEQQKVTPEEVPSQSTAPKVEQPRKALTAPKKAEVQLMKPSGPPPDWLKPFLDPGLDAIPAEVEEEDAELIELQPSPSDNTKSAALQPQIINRYKLR